MINTDNWQYYHKLVPNGSKADSNMLYTPTVNPEGTVMCMHYCIDPVYRIHNSHQIADQTLIDWFFEREVKFLQSLSNFEFTPVVHDIDIKNKKIFIEWNKETLSQIVFDNNRNLDSEFPQWKTELRSIMESLHTAQYYKMALYPHCFYISKDGKLKTIDYYSVVPYTEQYIDRKVIEGVIGKDGAYRFDESTSNGVVDFKQFFEITVNTHLSRYWPSSPFPTFFKEIYGVNL